MNKIEVACAMVIMVATAIGASHYIQASQERDRAAFVEASAAPAPAQSVQSRPVVHKAQSSGWKVRIPRSADGHYYADARVNGRTVDFLVDTGATKIALTVKDARKAGINVNTLVFDHRVRTANGVNEAALVRLREVAVGRARVRDVEALVIDGGLDISLLGMNWLSANRKMEATADALVIHP